MSMTSFRQGYFTPASPEKYVGNVNQIVYRSSWELRMCQFLDTNPHILRWSSEEIKIPYIKPTDGRTHHYYPDFWIEYCNRSNEVVREVVEIKPMNQVKKPTTRGKKKSTIMHEQVTHAVNSAKWAAALKWCDERGLKFRVITEKGLFR